MAGASMQGKVVVVTGATSGIGMVAAERLAGMGARLVLVARDEKRAATVLTRLADLSGHSHHTVHFADLSRIAAVKQVAADIAAAEARIDVLINNAGALFNRRRVTEDGLEMTFAVNHMAYFVLTHGLRARLAASGPSRIVSTASAAHRGAKLDFDDLQSSKNYRGFSAYSRSKLCNILFTRELARRLAGTGVTANCLHPGFVATRFGDHSGGIVGSLIGVAKRFAITPEKGAKTIVQLASLPDVAHTSGGYFAKCRPASTTREAQDDAAARRLWTLSAELAGLPAD